MVGGGAETRAIPLVERPVVQQLQATRWSQRKWLRACSCLKQLHGKFTRRIAVRDFLMVRRKDVRRQTSFFSRVFPVRRKPGGKTKVGQPLRLLWLSLYRYLHCCSVLLHCTAVHASSLLLAADRVRACISTMMHQFQPHVIDDLSKDTSSGQPGSPATSTASRGRHGQSIPCRRPRRNDEEGARTSARSDRRCKQR